MPIPVTGAVPRTTTPGYEGSNHSVVLDFHFGYLSQAACGIARAAFPVGHPARAKLARCTTEFHRASWEDSRRPGHPSPPSRLIVSQGTNGNADPPARAIDGLPLPAPYTLVRVNDNTSGGKPAYQYDERFFSSLVQSLALAREEGRTDYIAKVLQWLREYWSVATTEEVVTATFAFLNQAKSGGAARWMEDWCLAAVGELRHVLAAGEDVTTTSVVWTGAPSQNVNEGASITLQLQLADLLDHPTTIEVVVSGATYGEAYTTVPAPSGGRISVVIPAGQYLGTIQVNGGQVVADELVRFRIDAATLPPDVILGGDDDKFVRVKNLANAVAWDDAADTTSDATTWPVAVSLTRTEPEDVHVQVQLAGSATYGTDYTTVPEPAGGIVDVVVPADTLEGSMSLVIGDLAQDETVGLTIVGTSHAGVAIGTPATKTVTIQDSGNVPRPGAGNTGPRLGQQPTWFIGSTVVTDSWLAANEGATNGGAVNVYQEAGRWVIARVSVSGKFTIKTDAGVTFRDCETDGGATASQVGSDYGFTYDLTTFLGNDVRLEYCDIHNATTGVQCLNDWVVQYCNVHDHRSDGIKGGYTMELAYNWVHHLALWDGNGAYPHADCWQVGQGDGSHVHHNYFDLPYPPPPNYANPNACVFIKCEPGKGGIANVLVEENWLHGGGYTTYITVNGESLSGIVYRNNKLVQGSMEYGGLASDDTDYLNNPEVTVSGNRWWDPDTDTVGDVIQAGDPGGFAQE